MLKHRVKAEMVSAYWQGNRSMFLKAKITEGPNSYLDRVVAMDLTFEQIRYLAGCMEEAEKKLAITEKKLAEIDAANAE